VYGFYFFLDPVILEVKFKGVAMTKARWKKGLGFSLWQASNTWQRAVGAVLKTCDITHVQYMLLDGIYHLSRADARVTQICLAEYTHSDMMMVSKVLRTLVKKSLVLRADDRNDSRAKIVILTKTGRSTLEKAQKIMAEFETQFFAEVPADAMLQSLDAIGEKPQE